MSTMLACAMAVVRLSVFTLAVASSALYAQTLIRTGDIAVRGLSATAFPRITKLADNVYGYEQLDPTKRGVTVNNLIVVTPEGVVVAEGQGTTDNVKRLVSDIAAITPQPIRYVIVGSEHGDHVGGSSAFPPGVRFIAHPTSQARLAQQAAQQAAPGRAAAPVVVPTETVDRRRVLSLGGTDIELLFLGRAHTGGDLVVYLPQPRIVFTSEVFINRIFPSMANGYPTEWVATLRAIEAMNANVYVPAHGFIDPPDVLREELINYRRAIERVIAEGRRLHDAGVPVERAAAEADFGEFSTWTRVQNNAQPALARVYQELYGRLR